MGVGPTWFASPVRYTSYQCRQTMPFGAPMVFFCRSSIGPCSMWYSKYACTGHFFAGTVPL